MQTTAQPEIVVTDNPLAPFVKVEQPAPPLCPSCRREPYRPPAIRKAVVYGEGGRKREIEKVMGFQI